MRIILPMAGHGKRFVEAGYTVEKPLIEVNGKTLLEWALDPIPQTWERIFIVREDQTLAPFYNLAHDLDPNHANHWVILPGSTRGAALTVLAAAVALPPDEPVAVMNCDQWFACDLQAATAEALAQRWDGYILTFGEGKPWPGPAWSYAITDEWGQVTQVVEKPKVNVSEHATVGFYWWRRAEDLVHSICTMIAHRWTVNGEFYLAPAYNVLLGWKPALPNAGIAAIQPTFSMAKVGIIPVREFVGLGTPEQVKSFEQAAIVREP